MSLGAGKLEPCIACGEEVGSEAFECPHCGEMLQETKRKVKRKQRKDREDAERAKYASSSSDDDEGGVMGYVVFFLIFVVGNFILYMTTGWVIIPRR